MIDQEFDELSRKHTERQEPSKLRLVLAALRRREGLSQRELAKRAGIHPKGYSRIERHPEVTSIETFDRIAKQLGEPAWKILRHVEKSGSACVDKG